MKGTTKSIEPGSPRVEHRRMLRRTFLMGLGTMAVSGCVPSAPTPALEVAPPPPPVTPPMYYAMPQQEFPIPEADMTRFDPAYWRTEVDYVTDEKVGSLIVDTPNRYLYHALPGGRATRYRICVAKDGDACAGRAVVASKIKWPRWTPTDVPRATASAWARTVTPGLVVPWSPISASGPVGPRRMKWSRVSPSSSPTALPMAAWLPASRILWVLAPSTSIRTARTRSTAS